MNNMFSECSSLQSLDLSSFDTINVINMNNMFLNCILLESVNLLLFNTNLVNNNGIYVFKLFKIKINKYFIV